MTLLLARVRRALRLLTTDRATFRERLRIRSRIAALDAVNRWSRRAVTGDAPVVVNLTSFGHRIASVHVAIESIAAGTARPARMILWLDDANVVASPPPPLARLARRGLEIIACPDFGPHKKQYAFALTDDRSGHPLAVADDDVLYPRHWLRGLVEANRAQPEVVNGYRAHTIAVAGEHIAPYATWTPRVGTAASFGAICTGVSGIIYPPSVLAALRAEGEAFRDAAPAADDLWVHAVTVRHGIRTRQLGERQAEFDAVPGTQIGTLYRKNVREGGNDVQVAASYRPADVARIADDLARGL